MNNAEKSNKLLHIWKLLIVLCFCIDITQAKPMFLGCIPVEGNDMKKLAPAFISYGIPKPYPYQLVWEYKEDGTAKFMLIKADGNTNMSRVIDNKEKYVLIDDPNTGTSSVQKVDALYGTYYIAVNKYYSRPDEGGTAPLVDNWTLSKTTSAKTWKLRLQRDEDAAKVALPVIEIILNCKIPDSEEEHNKDTSSVSAAQAIKCPNVPARIQPGDIENKGNTWTLTLSYDNNNEKGIIWPYYKSNVSSDRYTYLIIQKGKKPQCEHINEKGQEFTLTLKSTTQYTCEDDDWGMCRTNSFVPISSN